jgi:GGDEF domain-containing protein/CheY-like chemotaxis protein
VLYADLNNFKTFNDTYGFAQGDHAIMTVANILQRVLPEHGTPDDFIGHIGGDDFAVLTTPECVDSICRAVIELFDHEISKLYHPDDWARGYVSGVDRYGVLRRFNLMTISIGVVTTQRRTFANEEELAHVAAEMKQYAKTQRGSHYAVDQRVLQLTTSAERRKNDYHTVLLAGDDASLRAVLRVTLQEHNYIVHEASDIETLRQFLDHTNEPSLVLADAHLGVPLWVLCAEQKGQHVASTIVVLVHDEDEIAQAQEAGVRHYLRQPLPLADIIEYVDRCINQRDCEPQVDAEYAMGCS